MKKFILNNITKLPVFVNKCLLSLNKNASLVYGKTYQKNISLLLEGNEVSDPEQLLLNTVNRAIKEVPYYKKRYSGMTIRSVQEFQDRIGFIDKQTVIDHFDEFINPTINVNDLYELHSTGGSTGQALKILIPKNRQDYEVSTVHYLWNKIGYAFSTRAVIRGHRLPNSKVFEINPITREFLFDGFRLTDSYFMQVYQVMKKHQIAFVHAYTYNAYEFARFLIKEQLDTGFIKGFLTASEMVYPYQQSFFDEFFPGKHYNFYGHTEKLIIAGFTTPSSNDYFFEPHYGFAELIDDDNQAIRTPELTGELVATGFLSPGMPLIRYRTNDYGEYAGNQCPKTGKKGLLLANILGRGSEVIYNKDKRGVTTTALNLHGDLLRYFTLLQYEQHEYGKLRVNLIVSAIHTPEASTRLMQYLKEKFNPDMQIEFNYLKEAPKLKNGKFLLLKSSLNN